MAFQQAGHVFHTMYDFCFRFSIGSEQIGDTFDGHARRCRPHVHRCRPDVAQRPRPTAYAFDPISQKRITSIFTKIILQVVELISTESETQSPRLLLDRILHV